VVNEPKVLNDDALGSASDEMTPERGGHIKRLLEFRVLVCADLRSHVRGTPSAEKVVEGVAVVNRSECALVPLGVEFGR
jgi:hypothetical protein